MAEQSTRYCNYTKNKFGSEICINLPTWIEEKTDFGGIINEEGKMPLGDTDETE